MNLSRRTVFILAFAVIGGALLVWIVGYGAGGGSIEIVAAEYGVPGRTCTAAPDVLKRASDACGGWRPRCLVSVSTGWCGDPAPGLVKTLTVDYTCGTTSKRAAAADGTPLVLGCP